ncbi:universal stress protein family protein [Klebsormidium nitens]|uniref:Universal stress protein family protein n=1 Tax=Klebsormidium nitens TaxID=105231 RepID=A0A1Y1II03_KLENI|nr:universal stress protein family protein [Klebsormidium nitens]|eukprot:GAQ90333.1 universal stress protein family protein [Klebsormidium nitens]
MAATEVAQAKEQLKATTGKRVLCALDNSDNSALALQFVLDELVKPENGDKLILFQATRAVDMYDDAELGFIADDQIAAAQERLVQLCLSNLKSIKAGIQVDAELVALPGDPRQLILDYVMQHPVDMVVVGTRGQGKFKSLFLGSVSSYLVSHCPVPVLVVPNPKTAATLLMKKSDIIKA